MATIDVKGKTIEVDEDGFLANLDDWNMDVANYFAQVEGIEMSEQHWEVVNFLREYYKQYQIAPMIKILVKEIGKKLGADKGNTKYLYELYPGGPPSRRARSPVCQSRQAACKPIGVFVPGAMRAPHGVRLSFAPWKSVTRYDAAGVSVLRRSWRAEQCITIPERRRYA